MPIESLKIDINDAESWIHFTQNAWTTKSEFQFGVFDTSTGEVVGATGMNHINSSYKIGNIGYWVSTPFTGQGIAVSAAQQAVNLGFSELGLNKTGNHRPVPQHWKPTRSSAPWSRARMHCEESAILSGQASRRSCVLVSTKGFIKKARIAAQMSNLIRYNNLKLYLRYLITIIMTTKVVYFTLYITRIHGPHANF